MNRLIKFRCWDVEYKRLFQVGNLNWEDDQLADVEGLQIINGEIVPRACVLWKQDEKILLPFTGLKDKNGKDIYEGDIVQIYKEDLSSEIIHERPKYSIPDKICKVSFFDGKFMIGIRMDLCKFRCEIKGNIYENPELLNGFLDSNLTQLKK